VRCLIVDDNAMMRRLLRSVVGELAAVFEECEDGAVALSAFARFEPDWVLMDLAMPGKGGLAATRSITTAFPGARVVIVSEHDDPSLRRAAREAGACGYVSKDDLFSIRGILGDFATREEDDVW
jgi:DNA-binding NarL/FixJ family response regulator